MISFEEQRLFEYFEICYSEYANLLAPNTDNFSKLEDAELISKAGFQAYNQSWQEETFRSGESINNGVYQLLILDCLKILLQYKSLYHFLVDYKSGVSALKSKDPDAFNKTVGTIKIPVWFLQQDAFKDSAALFGTATNSEYRRLNAMRRAFLSLMDLCLINSRTHIRKKDITFLGKNELLATTEKARSITKHIIEQSADLKTSIGLDSLSKHTGARKKQRDLIRSAVLFENGTSFVSYIHSNLENLIELEPFLIFIPPFQNQILETIPFSPSYKNNFGKIFRRWADGYHKERKNIRVKRAMLLFKFFIAEDVANQKVYQDCLARFLAQKKFGSYSSLVELLEDYTTEIV